MPTYLEKTSAVDLVLLSENMAEKMRLDDERIFGITKLKLQAFSLAALEMILGDIVVKVSSMMERTSIQIVT